MNFPKRILTIDMGRNCGWAFAQNGVPTDWGTDKILEDRSRSRLQVWRDWLKYKIIHFSPDHIVYEKPFIMRTVASQSLMQREGILLMLATDYDIPIIGVAVSTLKKATTENGRASKEEMMAKVNFLFGIETATDHEADAIACIVWAVKNLSEGDGRERSMNIKERS